MLTALVILAIIVACLGLYTLAAVADLSREVGRLWREVDRGERLGRADPPAHLTPGYWSRDMEGGRP